MTALPLAHSFLNLGRRPEDVHTFGGRAEAVVDILKIARSKEFKAYCRDFGIVLTSNGIAEHPSAVRLGLAHARAIRHRVRRR
jgi:hypothetical protein